MNAIAEAVKENFQPNFLTSVQINDQFLAAKQQFSAMGADLYIKSVIANTIQPDTGAKLFLAVTFCGPGSNETNWPTGIRLLAQSFAEASHICGLAEHVHKIFEDWKYDTYISDEFEMKFIEHLQAAGASYEVIARFNALIHGSDQNKIFGIGFNKTATTSLEVALSELGILTAPQKLAERLFRDWAARRFDRIIDHARRFEAYQDIPFSLPYTYQALDQAFPDARFILTYRNSAEEWYESLLRFSKIHFFEGGEPNWDHFERNAYSYPGFLNEGAILFWRWKEFGLYDRQRAIDLYNSHNEQVQEYFFTRPEKLLVINIAETGSYPELCSFIGRAPQRETFKKLNTSQ